MPGLAGGIARDIREGTLKKYLIQPIDMIGYLLSYRVAHKVAYIVTSALPYALLFFLCRELLRRLARRRRRWRPMSSSLVLAFLVGFFFEASVGMVGFWFLEVTSLLYIVMTLNFFISGQMFPLDLLPQPWATAAQGAAVPVPGLLPGGGLPGQGPGAGRWSMACWSRLAWAVVLHACWRAGCTASACGATARTEAEPHVAASRRYLRLLGAPGPLHPEPRDGLPRQLPGQGLGRGALAGDPARLLPHGLREDAVRSRAGPRTQYLFFVGCFFALNGLIETFFLDNCNEFAELVRTGDLDFLLLKPIDEQFLITCRKIDWGTAPERPDGRGA